MKHLKLYESFSNIDNHLQIIKDIFQDVIDEYNIENIPDGANNYGDWAGGSSIGLFYFIRDITKSHPDFTERKNIQIMVQFISRGSSRMKDDLNIQKKMFSQIKNNIKKEITRLESMGYKIIDDINKYSPTGIYRRTFYIDCF